MRRVLFEEIFSLPDTVTCWYRIMIGNNATADHPVVLTKAFVTYVRPILEYCTSVWSPHTVSNINKIESCQRWFTKRIKER